MLVVSVAVVGVPHTIVPDHWVPITLIVRQRGWSKGETARAALQAGIGQPSDTDGRFAVRLGLRMVRGLANADAATSVTARPDDPFSSVDDLWRRAGVPSASLVQIAEADAMQPSLNLARREALWAIKGLRDEPLPLFAAAPAREARTVLELQEPAVALRPMTAGGEVVEDYGHVGLTLRGHPITFLRAISAPNASSPARRRCRRGMGAGWRSRASFLFGKDLVRPRASCSSRSKTRRGSPIL